MAEQTDLDALAEDLSWSSGEMTRWSADAHPDHNRWSWRGDGHGEALRTHFREQAQALLDHGWTRTAAADVAVDAVDAVLAVMDGAVHRESHHVADWPEDERDLHRHGTWRSFAERSQALSRRRAEKIVAAVLASVATNGTGGTDV